jgi:hypothetical protein
MAHRLRRFCLRPVHGAGPRRMSPSSPLKFRTVGFPQYGFKPRPLRASLPVLRLNAPSPTLGYTVLFLPCPWAFARLIAGRPSPSSRPPRSTGPPLRSGCHLHEPHRVYDPIRQSAAPHGFRFPAYTAGPHATDLPSFHCRAFRACRPPCAGGSTELLPLWTRPCQASPSYQRVATHTAASASDTRRVEFTTLQGSLHAAARTFASHPGLAAGCFVERAFRGIRRRMSLRSKLDGRTGNLPSRGLSPRRSRQLSWLHDKRFKGPILNASSRL